MTVSQAFAQLAEEKPHTYAQSTLLTWLNRCEQSLYYTLYARYGCGLEPPEPYTESTLSSELRAPDPYSHLYVSFLATEVDRCNGETARYNNSRALYAAELAELGAHINRAFPPLTKNLAPLFPRLNGRL